MKKRKSPLLFFYLSMSLLLPIGTYMLSSCSDKDEPSPTPNPTPEDNTYVLKLKSSESVEFKEILDENDVHDIAEKETAYFGDRIQFVCPNELQFDNDSLSIVKANNIVEKYKIKWQEKKLFIHHTQGDIWEYCGEKDRDGKLLLNIGFYLIKSNNSQRTFTAIGQEYSLTSYSELIDKNTKDSPFPIIWLRIRYVFE